MRFASTLLFLAAVACAPYHSINGEKSSAEVGVNSSKKLLSLRDDINTANQVESGHYHVDGGNTNVALVGQSNSAVQTAAAVNLGKTGNANAVNVADQTNAAFVAQASGNRYSLVPTDGTGKNFALVAQDNSADQTAVAIGKNANAKNIAEQTNIANVAQGSFNDHHGKGPKAHHSEELYSSGHYHVDGGNTNVALVGQSNSAVQTAAAVNFGKTGNANALNVADQTNAAFVAQASGNRYGLVPTDGTGKNFALVAQDNSAYQTSVAIGNGNTNAANIAKQANFANVAQGSFNHKP